jgi:hypothetical protein
MGCIHPLQVPVHNTKSWKAEVTDGFVEFNIVVNDDTDGITDINASFYILFRLLLPDGRVVGVSVLRNTRLSYNNFQNGSRSSLVDDVLLGDVLGQVGGGGGGGGGFGFGRYQGADAGCTPCAGICYDFQKGICSRSNCRFSHDEGAYKGYGLPTPATGARPIARNPEKQKLLTRLGSVTLMSTIIPDNQK